MRNTETSLEPKVELVQGTNADELIQRIRQELARFNEMKTGDRHWSPLVLSLTDANAQIIGGLVGELFWNALHVELLWVADAHRRRGYGRRLMEKAEGEARARGANLVYLNTFSFQAPAFYERLGYEQFGELADTPKGAKRMWYVKQLTDDVA
jgi:GNAT superfamily N-acetyltransferase